MMGRSGKGMCVGDGQFGEQVVRMLSIHQGHSLPALSGLE